MNMGLDKTKLPDHLLKLISPEDRERVGLPTRITITDIIRSQPNASDQMPPKAHGTRYSIPVVLAFFAEVGLPEPVPEYRFDPDRKFKFDFAWPQPNEIGGLALEVQGGLFARIPGGHNRGAQIRREHEKRNLAAIAGWRILYCETESLCLTETAEMIRLALDWKHEHEISD